MRVAMPLHLQVGCCCLVPADDDGLVALPAEHTDAGWSQREETSVLGAESQPSCGEDAEAVAVREQQRVACSSPDALEQPVGPCGDLRCTLSFRRAVVPQRPARRAGAYLRGRAAF